MHQRVSRQVRLKSRPSGIPQAEHFEIVEAPVPSNGQVLVRNINLRWIPRCAVGSARSPTIPSL
jgi:NADPH-dependent curcumin reductase CurA